jgi:hypothetical protein
MIKHTVEPTLPTNMSGKKTFLKKLLLQIFLLEYPYAAPGKREARERAEKIPLPSGETVYPTKGEDYCQ